MLRAHTSKCSFGEQACIELAQSGVHTIGGEIIKSLTEHGFGSNGFNAKRIGKKFISPIQVNVVKIISAITEQSDLGEKDVSVTNCIGSSGLEILRESLRCVIFEK